MKPDTVIKLGDFEFSSFEIPERVAFGGRQHLVTHELVGGARVVDAMGRVDAPLAWTGMFRGEAALARARYLDGLRIAGKPLKLSWSELSYTAIIEEFTADFERAYKLPYRISLMVVKDLSAPLKSSATTGVDAAIRTDMTSATTIGDSIGDSALSSSLSSLDTAINAVSDFAKATQSTINSVLAPIAEVQARARILITSSENVLTNVATVGGILPNTPVAQAAARLTGQVNAMTQSPQLYNLQSVLGRMSGNLGTIGGGTKQVATGGGNLYSIAQQQYGDASEWTTLANANGRSDPQIDGLATIVVPASPSGSDGVLGA